MSCNIFLVISDRSGDRALLEALLACQEGDLAGIEPDRVTLTFWPKSWAREDPAPPFREIPASLEYRNRNGVLTYNQPALKDVPEFLDRLQRPIVALILLTKDLLEHTAVLRALFELLESQNVPVVTVAIEQLFPVSSGETRIGATYPIIPPPVGDILDVHDLPVATQAQAIQGRVVDTLFHASRAQPPTPEAPTQLAEESLISEERVSLVRRAAAAARLLVTPRHIIVLGPPDYYKVPEVWEAPSGPLPTIPRGSLSWSWRLRNFAPFRAVRNAWARAGGGLDWVITTIFAPPVVAREESFLIQAVFHLSEQIRETEGLAATTDPSARKRGFKTLTKEIRRGSVLVVHLFTPSLEVATAVQTAVWRGQPEPVTFAVRVPRDCPAGPVSGMATISLGEIPLGIIEFQLSVADRSFVGDPKRYSLVPLGDQVRIFHLAFISYASEDRPEVLKRVQMLRALDIHYFQDVLALEPFERWERRLFQEIDRCDLFLLFWSTPARDSKWVMDELHYALDRKHGDTAALPHIRLVIVEGPPVPQPQRDLGDLHFNDFMIYFIAATELEKSRRMARAQGQGENP